MGLFGKWSPSGYPYGTDFRIDGYYCIGSYDLFFNTHIKSIDDNFVNPSIRMVKQLLSYASKLYHESLGWWNPATDFFTDSAIAAQRKRLNEAYNNAFDIRIGDIEYVQELLIKAKIFKNKEEILKAMDE